MVTEKHDFDLPLWVDSERTKRNAAYPILNTDSLSTFFGEFHTGDFTFGARMVARINPSAELHLILDGQRLDELVKRPTALGVDIPMMLDPRIPAPGLEHPYEHLASMEVVIELENMIPIQISLQMIETEKVETVEQLFRALQLTGPGMIDHQLRLIK